MSSEQEFPEKFIRICNFVKDLSEAFGESSLPLKLYARLTAKTKPTNTKAIQKHITAFETFVTMNYESILNMDYTQFKGVCPETADPDVIDLDITAEAEFGLFACIDSDVRISYSETSYVEISKIFRLANLAEAKIIWKHIFAIATLYFPDKEQDIKATALQLNVSLEDDFINYTISKIKEIMGGITPSSADSTPEPSMVIANMAASGFFANMMTEIRTRVSQGMDMNLLMQKLKELGGAGGNVPDLSAMMSSMIPGLGGMSSLKIEEEK
jgi:hypothetical protein